MRRFVENLYALQTLDSQSPNNEEQVQAIRQKVPASMLAHFDRLRSRGKKGVALVRNGVCTGCHLRVATGVYNAAVLGASAISCGNCGSYLFVPQDELAKAPVSAPVPKAATAPKSRKAVAAV